MRKGNRGHKRRGKEEIARQEESGVKQLMKREGRKAMLPRQSTRQVRVSVG